MKPSKTSVFLAWALSLALLFQEIFAAAHLANQRVPRQAPRPPYLKKKEPPRPPTPYYSGQGPAFNYNEEAKEPSDELPLKEKSYENVFKLQNPPIGRPRGAAAASSVERDLPPGNLVKDLDVNRLQSFESQELSRDISAVITENMTEYQPFLPGPSPSPPSAYFTRGIANTRKPHFQTNTNVKRTFMQRFWYKWGDKILLGAAIAVGLLIFGGIVYAGYQKLRKYDPEMVFEDKTDRAEALKKKQDKRGTEGRLSSGREDPLAHEIAWKFQFSDDIRQTLGENLDAFLVRAAMVNVIAAYVLNDLFVAFEGGKTMINSDYEL